MENNQKNNDSGNQNNGLSRRTLLQLPIVISLPATAGTTPSQEQLDLYYSVLWRDMEYLQVKYGMEMFDPLILYRVKERYERKFRSEPFERRLQRLLG